MATTRLTWRRESHRERRRAARRGERVVPPRPFVGRRLGLALVRDEAVVRFALGRGEAAAVFRGVVFLSF